MKSRVIMALLVLLYGANCAAIGQSSDDKIAVKVSGHFFSFTSAPDQCTDVLYKEVATGLTKDAGGATPRSVRLAPKLYQFTCKCPSGDVFSQPTMVGQATGYAFNCNAKLTPGQRNASQRSETDDLIELHSWNDGNGNQHVFTVDGMADPDQQQFNRDVTQWFIYSQAGVGEPNLKPLYTCLAHNSKHILTVFPKSDCGEPETPLGFVAIHPTTVMQDKLLTCTNPGNGNHSASVDHCGAGDHPSDLGFISRSSH